MRETIRCSKGEKEGHTTTHVDLRGSMKAGTNSHGWGASVNTFGSYSTPDPNAFAKVQVELRVFPRSALTAGSGHSSIYRIYIW